MTDEHDHNGGPEGFDAVPGLARIALSAWWHTAGWAVRTSLRVPRQVVEIARSPERRSNSPASCCDAVAEHTSEARRRQPGQPWNPRANGRSESARSRRPPSSLREEGERLLRKSRDVRYEVDAHPAYERILSELAPDEGRILRLLLLDGPQPAVDVRTGGPVGWSAHG